MDLFFFIGSLYSYLTVMRVGALARTAGVPVRWRPFNLRAIMVEQNNIPRNNPVKMRYIWRDVERRARRHGLPFKPGLPYPVDSDGLANRVALVAAQEGWCEEYVTATYRAWFAEHVAPGSPAVPAAIIARADSEAVRRQFEEETEAARRLGIFGAPTFVVGGEIFWGDDRLEDALENARAGKAV
ncbi:MAG TPA: 2-hydroxychromene-2-carboxylate isomerase [Burkholderiales bacterium]|nr:2-hydroxychromene-2-carboxylate isomerase [Burkholderiales bacterium]